VLKSKSLTGNEPIIIICTPVGPGATRSIYVLSSLNMMFPLHMFHTAQATNFWDISLSQVLVFPCELCHYLFRLRVTLSPVRLLAPPQARTA
jgi:hypothetical protein